MKVKVLKVLGFAALIFLALVILTALVVVRVNGSFSRGIVADCNSSAWFHGRASPWLMCMLLYRPDGKISNAGIAISMYSDSGKRYIGPMVPPIGESVYYLWFTVEIGLPWGAAWADVDYHIVRTAYP